MLRVKRAASVFNAASASVSDTVFTLKAMAIACAPGEGANPGGVGSGGRLGHAKSLKPQRAIGDAGQVLGLLFGAAMLQQRAHRVHLRVTRPAVAAGTVDFLKDHRPGSQGQPRSAIFFGDQARQPACFGQGLRLGKADIGQAGEKQRDGAELQHGPRQMQGAKAGAQRRAGCAAQDQQHQQRHEGGEQMPLHAQNLRGQRQHPADGSARRRRLRGGWTVGYGHDGVPGEERAAMKEKALYFLISNKYI